MRAEMYCRSQLVVSTLVVTMTSVRQDMVKRAVGFLRHPKVKNAPEEKQIAFLKDKNLTQQVRKRHNLIIHRTRVYRTAVVLLLLLTTSEGTQDQYTHDASDSSICSMWIELAIASLHCR